MNNDSFDLKIADLRQLSNTTQCILEDSSKFNRFHQSSNNFYSKARSKLSKTNGFNLFQNLNGEIQTYNEIEDKYSINYLNVEQDIMNSNNVTKNTEELYNQENREIVIPEFNPNKNDPKIYITKERQSKKGLYDEANGFNIQRFLKRVAEEKLYGTFIQSLKSNDMQGQAMLVQRRMQQSQCSPLQTNSLYENKSGKQYIYSLNGSPSRQKHTQSNELETFQSSTVFDSISVSY